MTITGSTLCSGIGAPEEAALTLGLDMRWLWCSEIDPAASEVHRQRHGTPNLGDMTAEDFTARAIAAGIPDVLVAGTPCQAFSVAGLRRGLTDARGNLTLRMVRILDDLSDAADAMGRSGPALLWENVPGALSDKTNAFGCLIGALAGEDGPIMPPEEDPRLWGSAQSGVRYPKWPVEGAVMGPRRLIAWRVLDAQGWAPQRRRRIFLVALQPRWGINPERVLFESQAAVVRNLGDAARVHGAPAGFKPGGLADLYRALLPLWAGVPGHHQAGQDAGQGASSDVGPCLASRRGSGGGLGTDTEIGGGLIPLRDV